MKKVRVTTGILAMAVIALSAISCKDANKNEPAVPMSNQMHQADLNAEGEIVNEQNPSAILGEYLSIKDALVKDNSEEAADAGAELVSAFDAFDASGYSDSQQNELKDIVMDAKEHAQHISESPMEHQREHFKILSKDITDMVAITGSEQKLYEQFCPMYDKGSAWLSASNEVKNPYYGSEMLTCGKVQREIN